MDGFGTNEGVIVLAATNRPDAPTPTNISTKSEPLIIKNGTPASPATAFASNVLPVPGWPTKRTPFGILAPGWTYKRRKSRTNWNHPRRRININRCA